MERTEQRVAKEIGLNIKVLRTRAKLSQELLADRVGTKRSYISEIENGKRNISLVTMIKLAKALRSQLHELVEGVKLKHR